MNDRAAALLEQYDIEVIRVRKGRGALLCDTPQGVLIFKEYAGTEARLALQNRVLRHIQNQKQIKTDTILPTKTGELWVKDKDGVSYILKTYFEGRECDIYQKEECLLAMELLAKLHNCMQELPDTDSGQLSSEDVVTGQLAPANMGSEALSPADTDAGAFSPEASVTGEEPDTERLTAEAEAVSGQETSANKEESVLQEYERHNKELVRIRNFLRKKKQKQPFERELYRVLEDFILQARKVTDDWSRYVQDLDLTEPMDTYYHGNYQYHNIIFDGKEWYVINFEKCQQGSQVRDVFLMLRKLLEKSDWQLDLGRELLAAYTRIRPLSAYEAIDLYYRLAYPEKFWKIVNFYYNAPKAWIPERNMEKLQKVLEQEHNRQAFLKEMTEGIYFEKQENAENTEAK